MLRWVQSIKTLKTQDPQTTGIGASSKKTNGITQRVARDTRDEMQVRQKIPPQKEIKIRLPKGLPEGRQMGGDVRGADEDVVQVDEGVGDVRQEAVHQALKRLGSILQTK